LVNRYESYRESVVERRHDEFEKRRRDAERELEKAMAARRKEFRDRKAREKREREERERSYEKRKNVLPRKQRRRPRERPGRRRSSQS
jgi:translation initiation factor 3 subunit A